MINEELLRQNRELREPLIRERQIAFLKEVREFQQAETKANKALTGPEQKALESSLAEYLDDNKSSELEDY